MTSRSMTRTEGRTGLLLVPGSSLDSTKRLWSRLAGLNKREEEERPERSHCGRRVEDDLGAVEAEQEPVEGMMPAVADVDGDSAKLGLEDGVTRVALHVVGGLRGGAGTVGQAVR